MKITKYTCDGCGQEPDPNKNFLMLSGMVIKFTQDGPKKVVMENYFCHVCSSKLLDVIEQLNVTSRADTDA